MNIKPIFDNVLIQPLLKDKTDFGIWLPEQRDEDKDPIRIGRVLAVGPGKAATKTGVFIPTEVKKGWKVAYKNYTFIRYLKRETKKQVALCSENDILAVIK